MVRLGTKWLSMTSKWIQSAPAEMTRVTSSPRRAKSADRIEGAIRYMGRSFPRMARGSVPAPLALGAAADVAVHRVAHGAAGQLLADEAEAGLCLAAAVDRGHHAGRILDVEHRHAEHLPEGVARVRVVGVLDASGVAAVEPVLDLQRDLRVRQLRQEAELALGDLAYRVGHHARAAPGGASVRHREGGREVGSVGGRVVEGDLAPGIERLLQG